MNKILYIGVHSCLEYDECKLFTEMGYDVFSYGGAYADPKGHYLLPRPGITGMPYHEDLHKISQQYPRTDLPMEVIEWADVVIIMNGYHDPYIIDLNWRKLQKRKVVWRTIGQSLPHLEKAYKAYRNQGLKIVRMSPKERGIPNYIGEDALIRFYKDPDEYKDWNGNDKWVINFTQTLKGRRIFCHYDHIMQIIAGFPTKIFGSGNEDLGYLNGGEINYQSLKEQLRDNRCFVYAGTWPSPYTLSIIEAMMTGVPVIAIGKQMAEQLQVASHDKYEFYEVSEIIKNSTNGFCSDNIDHLRDSIEHLMSDYELAKRVGQAGQQTAKDLFSKDKAKIAWKEFFEKL